MNKALMAAGVLIVVVVFAAVTLANPDRRNSGPRLDPRSTGHDGARAAFLLLEEQGVAVTAGDIPRRGAVGSLIILVDDLDVDGWAAVERFVRGGGDLVVAEPFAALAAHVNREVSLVTEFGSDCSIDELATVKRIEAPVVRTFIGGDLRCLETTSGSAAVVRQLGEGRVLSLGTAHTWRNDALAEEDNAALVVGTAAWASEPVRVLVRGPVGTGDRTLRDLVPPWVWAVLAQVGVAAVLYSLWRAIRLGPPMREPETAQFDASVLTQASALLTQRTGDDRAAASSVVERWRTDLRRTTGWASDDVDELVDCVEFLDLDEEGADLLKRSVATDFDDPLVQAGVVSGARRLLTDPEPDDLDSSAGQPAPVPQAHPDPAPQEADA
jgi:hypothetical protein